MKRITDVVRESLREYFEMLDRERCQHVMLNEDHGATWVEFDGDFSLDELAQFIADRLEAKEPK